MGEGEQRVDEAVVLLSTRTIVGLYFDSVAAGGTGFEGSPPIPGKVRIEWVFLQSRAYSPLADLIAVQLAVASEVPGSQAALDAGEQLFPLASTRVGRRSSLSFGYAYSTPQIPAGVVVSMNGRRLVGGLYNAGAFVYDFYVAVGVVGVVGGDVRGAAAFLSGERLREG